MFLDLSEQYDKMYCYCYFKVNGRCLAEDLAQETFLRYFSQTSYISWGKQLAKFVFVPIWEIGDKNLFLGWNQNGGMEMEPKWRNPTGMSLATCPRNFGITLAFPPWIS